MGNETGVATFDLEPVAVCSKRFKWRQATTGNLCPFETWKEDSRLPGNSELLGAFLSLSALLAVDLRRVSELFFLCEFR